MEMFHLSGVQREAMRKKIYMKKGLELGTDSVMIANWERKEIKYIKNQMRLKVKGYY